MKLSVKQMGNWNSYAYCAEDVDRAHHQYFRDDLWWQLGNGFIKVYDNVPDFCYCAENFSKYGDEAVRQQLNLTSAPWEQALDSIAEELNRMQVDWYVHGSTALALWGIHVAPRGVDIIIANAGEFDRVRERFYKRAIYPFQRCDNWVMSGLGSIFEQAVVGFAFHNRELEPYPMDKLAKLNFSGQALYCSTLDMLKRDNQTLNRPERVRMIEEKQNAQRC